MSERTRLARRHLLTALSIGGGAGIEGGAGAAAAGVSGKEARRRRGRSQAARHRGP
jgi:hypothetical protein